MAEAIRESVLQCQRAACRVKSSESTGRAASDVTQARKPHLLKPCLPSPDASFTKPYPRHDRAADTALNHWNRSSPN